MWSTRCSRRRSTASSSCTPTTSRTRRPPPCGLPARPAPTRLPASRPASPACGGRRTAAPTRPRSTCWRRSAPSTASPRFVAKAKDKNSGFRLMGFGHRVYKNYDPRAKVMQQTCHEVLDALGIKDEPLLDGGHGAGAHRAAGRLLHREEALSEHRLLLGHHAARDGLPRLHVHGAVRGGAHRRLGRAVERR